MSVFLGFPNRRLAQKAQVPNHHIRQPSQQLKQQQQQQQQQQPVDTETRVVDGEKDKKNR